MDLQGVHKNRLFVSTRDIAFIGMATGLVLAVTYISGYAFSLRFNLGDATIVCLAIALPMRRSLPAAIIGSVLADILLGGYNYAPFTLVLKGLLALLASRSWGRNWPTIGMALGEICIVFGYYGADLLYYGPAVALVDVYWNLGQAAAGILVGMLFFFGTYRLLPKQQWAKAAL